MADNIDTTSLPRNIWGTPTDGGRFSPEVKQTGPSCVWSAECQVMKDYGFQGTAEDVIRFATEHGWYNPKTGTSAMHIGKALEAFGVPCTVKHGASINDLLTQVMKGKKVLVTLDADELWSESAAGKALHGFLDIFGLHGVNHALSVVGFDNSNPRNPMIIVTDTGAGHSAKAYPVKHFVGAWKDGHCRMVFPNEAPPHAVPFNFPLGRDGKMLSVQEWVDSLREEPIGDLNTHNSSAESLNNASFQKTHGVSFHGIAGADESYQVDNISEQANCENAISMSNQAGDELSGNINGGLNVHSRPGAPGVDLMGVSQQVGAPGVDLMSISQQHSAPGVDLMSVSQQPSGTCEDMMGTSRSDFSGIGGMAGFPFSVEHSIGDFAEGPGFIS